MGISSSLVCCGAPEADAVDLFGAKYSQRYADTTEQSLLEKLQQSWKELLESPTSSDSDTEEMFRTSSTTSGSRLLCDFYSLVLERDQKAFFLDAEGHRTTSHRLKFMDQYFDLDAMERRSIHTTVEKRHVDRYSSLSSTTMYSEESDYWSSMDAMLVDPAEHSHHSLPDNSSTLLLLEQELQDPLVLFSPVRVASPVEKTSSSYDSLQKPWDAQKPWEAQYHERRHAHDPFFLRRPTHTASRAIASPIAS